MIIGVLGAKDTDGLFFFSCYLSFLRISPASDLQPNVWPCLRRRRQDHRQGADTSSKVDIMLNFIDKSMVVLSGSLFLFCFCFANKMMPFWN